MPIPCSPSLSCPLLYSCQPSLQCVHNPVFPISTYQYCIYALFPLCSAICNLSGNSFGQFKILLLMDLLNYQQNQATVIAYPLITGTALFNFLYLIFRRHPSKDTSLVDYNIVMVIVPNVLFGSTIGGLVNKFLPPIAADSIILVIMVGFAVKFYRKYTAMRKAQREREGEVRVKEVEMSDRRETEKLEQVQISKALVPQYKQRTTAPLPLQPLSLQPPCQSPQLLSTLAYERTLHLPHIAATIVIFLIFETLSFLAQGKIIPFTICSRFYPAGIVALFVLVLIYDICMYRYTQHKLQHYKTINYEYEVQLDNIKYYAVICLGSFMGGFNSGTFSIGNSTTIILALLMLDIEPCIASATVGYQVVFAGSGSLIQAYITDQIASDVIWLFLGITFVIGGLLSLGLKVWVSGYQTSKVDRILVLVVFSLVSMSVVALVVSIVLGYVQFGAEDMQAVPFKC